MRTRLNHNKVGTHWLLFVEGGGREPEGGWSLSFKLSFEVGASLPPCHKDFGCQPARACRCVSGIRLDVGHGLCSSDTPLGRGSLLCPSVELTLAGADLGWGRAVPIKMVLAFDIHTITWIFLLALLPWLEFNQE